MPLNDKSDALSKAVLDFSSNAPIKEIATKLGISPEVNDEMDAILKPFKEKNIADTYWLPLRNSFSVQNEFDIPIPFVKLWQALSDLEDDTSSGLVHSYTGIAPEATINAGLFWRFYACYRYGLDWKIVMEQLHKGVYSYEIMEFWRRELKLLNRRLIPYVIINRFIIMPVNRFMYWLSK